MANIKSAAKRAETNELKRQRNVSRRTELKTLMKKYLDALETKNFDLAKTLLKETESKMARAKGKGIVKKQTASRKISRLAKKLSKSSKPSK